MVDDALDAELDAALDHHRAGRLQKAEQCYRTILSRIPDNSEALNLLGALLEAQGAYAEATDLLRQATESDPDFADALVNLARVLTVTGNPEEALTVATRAALLDPGLADAHLQAGLAAIALKDFAAASRSCETAAALAPENLACHFNLGLALAGQRAFRDAAAALRAALSLDPDRVAGLTTLASVLGDLGDHDEAIQVSRRAVSLAPGDPATHAALATALTRGKYAVEAIKHYRIALHLAPAHAELWTMLGSSLASIGQFDESSACHRHALALNPNSHESRRELLAFRRDTLESEEIGRLIDIVADESVEIAARITAGFALGEQFDVQHDFDRAFDSFAEANRLARLNMATNGTSFDRAAFTGLIDEQIRNFPRDLFARAAGLGNLSDLPVFIVGLPRSGTSLVEQIAASHSKVFGGGELEDIAGILGRLNMDRRADGKVQWRPESIRAEANAHIGILKRLSGGKARVTDKMPDNILRLGQIAILFPNARIVLCRRDLRDVALSCYSKQFTHGLPWTNDLADIAFRMAETERLVAHWRDVLPVRLMEIDYQNLIADLEGEGRRLIGFLGLDWEDACLSFHKTQREVFTASRWQVRQPLYSSSVGRWRNYRAHLVPLLEGLAGMVPED